MRHWINIVLNEDTSPNLSRDLAHRSDAAPSAIEVLTDVSTGQHGRTLLRKLFKLFSLVAANWSLGRPAPRFAQQTAVYEMAQAALQSRGRDAEVLGRQIGDLLDNAFSGYQVEPNSSRRDYLEWDAAQSVFNAQTGANIAIDTDGFSGAD